MRILLTAIMALNIMVLFTQGTRTDSYQTLFDLKDTQDNVRKINDTFYTISTGKQDKVFDVWTATPTVQEIQNGNIVTFETDIGGRLIYKVNDVVYYIQGTMLP